MSHIYNIAKPDGLTLGLINPASTPISFSGRKR